MKKIILLILLFGLFFFIPSCTTPYFKEVEFKDDYINYNENATINFKIYNPQETTFNGKIEIRAVLKYGFFNCFESANKNFSILPQKSYNGGLIIENKNNDKCKGYDFDVYFTLKDLNSDEILTKKSLILKVKE